MKVVPSYSKILTLGSTFTENALIGSNIIIQEKVDGSQFDFGINEDKELVMRSHSVALYEHSNAMFDKAVNYLLSIQGLLKEKLAPDTYLYCEYLQKPKHNTLKYDRTPTNNLVLFDATVNGVFQSREELAKMATLIDIDLIPELYVGTVDVDKIKELLETPSYLGTEKIEGVVIKNHWQKLELHGHIWPLFTKFVREDFKERHKTEWKVGTRKGSIETYVESFKSEARWLKAIQYLRDTGTLDNALQSIPVVIKRVQADILEEEAENIKNELYKKVIPDILRKSTSGFPEWWKAKLLENLNQDAG